MLEMKNANIWAHENGCDMQQGLPQKEKIIFNEKFKEFSKEYTMDSKFVELEFNGIHGVIDLIDETSDKISLFIVNESYTPIDPFQHPVLLVAAYLYINSKSYQRKYKNDTIFSLIFVSFNRYDEKKIRQSWDISFKKLVNSFDIIHAKSNGLNNGMWSTGKHCLECPSKIHCRFVFEHTENNINQVFSSDKRGLSTQELERMLVLLQENLAMIKSLEKAYEAELRNKLLRTNGSILNGVFEVKDKKSALKWNNNDPEYLKDKFPPDLLVFKKVPLTPNQVIKQGVKLEDIEELTHRETKQVLVRKPKPKF